MLSNHEKNTIIKKFLSYSINLSYEYITYKKNSIKYDCFIAIPNGKKYFVWFTQIKDKNVCVFLEYFYNKIINISIKNVSFHIPDTIFYGTFFIKKNIKIFSIENIFYHKNKNISLMIFYKKLNIIKNIFQDVDRTIENNNYIYFGLPLMNTNLLSLLNTVNKLNHNIYFIQCIQSSRHINIKYTEIKKEFVEKKKITFLIKPDIINDIYHLYYNDKNEYIKYDVACIPNIKISIQMNSLFRIIKENNNLDSLEESDDEEEFENTNIHKYVFIDREIRMECEYHLKFKSWIPINTTNNEIITWDELKSFVG
jgi:hypothetical protein